MIRNEAKIGPVVVRSIVADAEVDVNKILSQILITLRQFLVSRRAESVSQCCTKVRILRIQMPSIVLPRVKNVRPSHPSSALESISMCYSKYAFSSGYSKAGSSRMSSSCSSSLASRSTESANLDDKPLEVNKLADSTTGFLLVRLFGFCGS